MWDVLFVRGKVLDVLEIWNTCDSRHACENPALVLVFMCELVSSVWLKKKKNYKWLLTFYS